MYAAFRTRQGRLKDAIKWSLLAVEEAQAADARDALAHAYFLLDWAYAALGRYEEAVYSPLALSIYEELGDLHRQGLVLNNMGVFAHFQGRWDDALDLYRRAGDAWDKMGNRWHVALTTLNVGEVLSDQGLMDEAEPLLLDALRVARACTGPAPRRSDPTPCVGRIPGLGGSRKPTPCSPRRESSNELEAEARIAECFVLESQPRAALKLSKSALGLPRPIAGRRLRRHRHAPAERRGARYPSQARSARQGAERARARARGGSTPQPRLRGCAPCSTRSPCWRKRTAEPAEDLLPSSATRSLERLGVTGIPEIPLPALAGKKRRNPSPSRAGRARGRAASTQWWAPAPRPRGTERRRRPRDRHCRSCSSKERPAVVALRALLDVARGVGHVAPEVLRAVVRRAAALRGPRIGSELLAQPYAPPLNGASERFVVPRQTLYCDAPREGSTSF